MLVQYCSSRVTKRRRRKEEEAGIGRATDHNSQSCSRRDRDSWQAGINQAACNSFKRAEMAIRYRYTYRDVYQSMGPGQLAAVPNASPAWNVMR